MFYIFGGLTSDGPQNDLWSFDLTGLKWKMKSPLGKLPPPCYRFAFTDYYDKNLLKFIIFGGTLISNSSTDTYM